MKHAQVWSMDFISSIIIFFLVVSVTIFAWNYTINKNTEQVNFNEMENKALMISDIIIRSQGQPPDWDTGNVQTIGLASEENVINQTKTLQFITMDYNIIRQLWGIRSYNFYLEMQYINGTTIQTNGNNITKGTYPINTSRFVVPVERYVLYNGKVSKLSFILWN